MNTLKRKTTRLSDLLHAIPWGATFLYILSVVLMNVLARWTLVSLPWVAIDFGTTISWGAFLYVDIVTRHFGAKSANMMSVVAMVVNLTVCAVCVLLSRIFRNPSLDMVVGGQWSILLASTIGFLSSALVNNSLNVFIGRHFFRKNPYGRAAFAVRSYTSTMVSQLTDNFLFAWLAFVVFPHIPGALQVRWTVVQCIGSAFFGMLFELLSEIIFSPLGYRIAQKWRERGVGAAYLNRYCPNGVL